MYRRLKVLCTMCILSVIMVSMIGCGSKTDPAAAYDNSAENYSADAVAIVVGNRQNAPCANFDPYADIIKNTCAKAGHFTFIESDGQPYVYDTIDIPASKEGISESKREMIAESQATEICQYIKTFEPKTSEADPLKALVLASKMLSNYEGEKLLIIQDTGIATSGTLNMSSSLLSMDTESIVKKLKEAHSIPSFAEGTKVIWIGLAEPVGNQPAPSERDADKIREIYESILIEGGLNKDDITFKMLGEYETQDNRWPQVSTVDFPEATILIEDDVAFNKNSTEFADEKKALNQIEMAAGNYSTGEELLVVGFASSEGSPESNIALSKARAEKVGKILSSEYALNTTAIGLGYDSQYCIDDQNNEEAAKKNRKILILKKNSQLAQEMMDRK